MTEDLLCELLIASSSYLPNETEVRNTIEKFSMLDAPAVIKRITKSSVFEAIRPHLELAFEGVETKTIADHVILYLDMYYPNVLHEIEINETKAQLFEDVMSGGIKVIKDADR